MGTPRHKLTEERRQMVENASGLGMPYKLIAVLVGCSENTLVRRYKKEILQGRARAGFNVAKTAYDRAMAGDGPMLKYWLSTQLGWREPIVEDTRPKDEPIQQTYSAQRDELLAEYYERIEKAKESPADSDSTVVASVGPTRQIEYGPDEDEGPSGR